MVTHRSSAIANRDVPATAVKYLPRHSREHRSAVSAGTIAAVAAASITLNVGMARETVIASPQMQSVLTRQNFEHVVASSAIVGVSQKSTFVVARSASNAAVRAHGSVPEAVMAKLERISQLHDGWDGPGSQAVQPAAMALYRSLMGRWAGRFPDDLEPMPTYSGGLRMEWDRGEDSFVAELGAAGEMFVCMLNSSDDVAFERETPEADLVMLHDFYLRPDRVT